MELEYLASNPVLEFTVGPLGKLFYFSKALFLHPVNRDTHTHNNKVPKYLLHKVVVQVRPLAECSTHGRHCCCGWRIRDAIVEGGL